VVFDAVAVNETDDPEQALIDRIGAQTRLMAVSSVHFATGLRLDLDRLSRACQDAGVLLCVDAIQSLGALRLDLTRTPVDFVVADGHKWLLGPEGLGLMYVHPRLQRRLRPSQFGWAMREDPADFDPGPWRPARSARRFECGSPNMLGIQALNASLSLLEEIGLDEVERLLMANIAYLRTLLEEVPGLEIATPETAPRRSGIVSFSLPGVDSEALYKDLMAQRVICACRGGRLRFSPHFYTRKGVMERAVQILIQSSKL
jgi:selenocysteine lyase/cysteine desulfurase